MDEADESQVPPPTPTGRFSDIDTRSMTGMLMPALENNQPVLLGIPGSPHLYLPLFSSKVKLDELMEAAAMPYDKIRQIDNGPEFLTELSPRRLGSGVELRVILDPHMLANGRVRYVELKDD